MFLEQTVQDVGLHEGAGKALENKSLHVLRNGEFFLDELYDNFVRHQLAVLVECGDPFPGFGVFFDFTTIANRATNTP